jgi:hypothetical protein
VASGVADFSYRLPGLDFSKLNLPSKLDVNFKILGINEK